MGGWIIMLGWRRSGLRPTPSAGAVASRAKGDSKKTTSPQKNAASTSRVAVAIGAIARIRRRVRNRITLDHALSSSTHSRSDPACEDHTAVAR